ncbi:hypothetical protein KBD45_01660 [Candidatus Dojkabacteria bacterium]|nr:hypothetical protein [Candidatus Dojkabacteria bacterium]
METEFVGVVECRAFEPRKENKSDHESKPYFVYLGNMLQRGIQFVSEKSVNVILRGGIHESIENICSGCVAKEICKPNEKVIRTVGQGRNIDVAGALAIGINGILFNHLYLGFNKAYEISEEITDRLHANILEQQRRYAVSVKDRFEDIKGFIGYKPLGERHRSG